MPSINGIRPAPNASHPASPTDSRGSTERRRFLKIGAGALGTAVAPSWLGATTAPAIIGSDSTREGSLKPQPAPAHPSG
jgi:hypothetical protein